MVAVEAGILNCVRPMFSFTEKQIPHPFVCIAEEVLVGSWPFRVELPHVERPTLAWQDSVDQHHLNHVDKNDVPVKEGSNAAL